MAQQEFDNYLKHEKAHWWFVGRRAVLRGFLTYIPNIGRKSILEVGCGTGGNLRYLFDIFDERVGVELDSYAFDIATHQAGPHAKIYQMDAEKLLTLGRKFDCIAFCDVLYHANIRNVDSVINQTTALLRPGGHLLITDGAFNFLEGAHSKNCDSARRFTRAGLEGALRRHGYEIVKSSYWGLPIFFLLLIKRQFLDRLSKVTIRSPETEFTSPWLLAGVLKFLLVCESRFIQFRSLPFGASVAILARKSEAL